jgi:TRAP-type C4-dicarboxylate transport system permease small subunit
MTRRIYDGIVSALVVVAFSVMLIAALAGTATRYLTFLPVVTWGEELTRYGGIWSVFLVSGITIRHGAHLGVDMLTARLPLPLRRALAWAIYLIMLAFMVILVVYGVNQSMHNMQQRSASLQLPMGLVTSCIPIGGVLMIVELLGVMWRDWKGLPPFLPRIGEGIE